MGKRKNKYRAAERAMESFLGENKQFGHKHVGKGGWEVWSGSLYGGVDNYFCCYLAYCPKTKKWSATHNSHPSEGSDRYRHDTPEDAVLWYQAL